MMVSVETLKGLERRMQVAVPASRVQQQVDKRLLNVSRTARIKGFRPGKAPIHVVRKHYGAQVRDEVVGDLIRESFAEAVQQQQMVPVGGPRIESLPPGEEGELKYAATFEIYPKVDVGGLEGMTINRPEASVADSDVDAMLESLRSQRPEFLPVERPAADQDRLTVDFEGTHDGEPFEGGKAEGHQFQLGTGRMMKDFEEGLRGATAGETRSFDVGFPPDHPSTKLAGKTAQFKVTVKSVEEMKLPELDDAFCRAFGVEEGGVEALRAEVRENMERELGQAIKNRLKAQVMDRLLEANPLELPGALVDQEIRGLQMEAMRRMGARNARQVPARQPFEQPARRRVALGLLLGEAVNKAGIRLDAGRVQARLEEIAAGFEDPAAARQQYAENEGAMRQLQMMVLEDQLVDYILEKAQVTAQPASFKDIMNFGADASSEQAG
ncbi:MAG: trigger factor [Steroidobacteraceae bacterium]